MTRIEVENALKALGHKNGQIRGFVTLTTPKVNKSNRTTKEKKDWGLVTIRKSFSAMVGVCYENAVNNQQERDGGERDFVAQKPYGKHYYDGSTYMLQNDNDEHKFYVSMDEIGGAKREYFRDGQPMTEAEVEELREYMPKPSASKIAGRWRTPSVESIVSIS